ncbi:MAG: class I SAM-dependent methyltransferase [Candidatus Njordarchaeales archaeon]
MVMFYDLFISKEFYDPESDAGRYRMEFLIDALKEHRRLFGSKALDIGCGAGTSSFALEKLGLDVTGIDIEESFVLRAREIAAKKGYKARFFVMDAKSITINEEFDSIFMLGDLIFHLSVSDFIEIVERLKGLLKSNGVLVMEYSDFIESLFRKEELVPLPTELKRRTIFSYDPENGRLRIIIITKELEEDKYEAEEIGVYIWAPWILEQTLSLLGFEKLLRERFCNKIYLDIYTKRKFAKGISTH